MMLHLRSWLAKLPFKVHWLLVLLMAGIIPFLTRGTERPGEFYPFSNFPMYSTFAADTYYVFVTDLMNEPIAIGPTFGLAPSDLKKTYDRKLGDLKPLAPKGTRKIHLPAELKARAAEETLRWLHQNASHPEKLTGRDGLRLHHVDIVFEDGKLLQQDKAVGEISF